MANKLRLNRGQFSSFLKDFESIRQFELLFSTVNSLVATDTSTSLSGDTAIAMAGEALAALSRIKDALDYIALAPPEQDSVVTSTNVGVDTIDPPAREDNSLVTDYIDINVSAPQAVMQPGRIRWDDGEKTAILGLTGGNVELHLGQEELQACFNDTGASLNKGVIVQVTGAQGNRLKVTKAQANTEATSIHTVGFTDESIANGAEGFVINSGLIRNLNTINDSEGNALTAGDTLYLSTSIAGGYTKIKPSAPNHMVIVGFVVRVHASVGSIFVKIDNGYEIDELHNVLITAPRLAGSLLIYDATVDVWKNARLTDGGDGITITNGDASITLTHDTSTVTPATYGSATQVAQFAVNAQGHVTSATNVTISGVAPSLHASTHQHGGSDEIATATAAANAIPKAGAGGTLSAGWMPSFGGDVSTTSGSTTTTIASNAVTLGKIQTIGTDRLLGRDSAGGGNVEQLTVSGGIEFTDLGGIQTSAFTGDVTKTAGGTATTIANDAVTNAKLANMAANSIKGNNTGASADPLDLNGTQATAMLDVFTSSLKGLAPQSGGGTSNYLRADGTWNAPPGTGGSNAFGTIAVAGQSNVVADAASDTLTLIAGSNVSITTDASNDSVTINASQPTVPSASSTVVSETSFGLSATAGAASTYARGDHTHGTPPALTGDVTSTTGGLTTIGANKVLGTMIANKEISYDKIQNIPQNSVIGRVAAGDGVPKGLSGTEVTAILDVFTSSLKGLAPQSGGGTSNYLRADGTWNSPPARLVKITSFDTGQINTSFSFQSETKNYYAEVIGGGGGSVTANSGATTSCALSGGGGAGAYVAGFTSVTAGATYRFTVGAGGGSATNGGSSSFQQVTPTLITLFSAGGGTAGSLLTGGSTLIGVTGGAGGAAANSTGTGQVLSNGGGGGAGIRLSASSGISGQGGNSIFGGGGISVIVSTSNSGFTGNNGTSPGAGGGGPVSTSNAGRTAGSGANGFVRIWEFG